MENRRRHSIRKFAFEKIPFRIMAKKFGGRKDFTFRLAAVTIPLEWPPYTCNEQQVHVVCRYLLKKSTRL